MAHNFEHNINNRFVSALQLSGRVCQKDTNALEDKYYLKFAETFHAAESNFSLAPMEHNQPFVRHVFQAVLSIPLRFPSWSLHGPFMVLRFGSFAPLKLPTMGVNGTRGVRIGYLE